MMNQRVYLKYVLLLFIIFVVHQLGCNKSILDENYGDFVYPKSVFSKAYEFTKDASIETQMQKLQDVSNPLTLEDCYKIALMNNEGVILAGKGIEIAKTDLWVANLSWIPRLSIQGELSYRNSENLTEYDNPSYDPLDPSSGSPTIQSKIGSQENASGLAEILFPIYLFGRIVNNVDLRTAKLDIAFADSRRTKQQVIYLVVQLYTTILELEKTVEVLKSSIIVIDELLKNAQNFFEEGIITKNEVLVLEVTLSSRKQALLEAENALKQTTYQFNSILNLNITRKTKLDKLDELPKFMLSEVPLVNLALHYRPEIVKSMSQYETSEAQLRLAQNNRWPLLYGFVDITAASEKSLVNNAWMTFGARMQWQILDSGTTSAMIRQSKTAIEMQKLQTRMLFKDIMIDVRSSFENLKIAENKLNVSRKRVEQATENLRILENKFKGAGSNSNGGTGVFATAAEVLEAETLLLDAKREFFSAIFGIHRAWAKLEYSTGLKLNSEYASRNQLYPNELMDDPYNMLDRMFDMNKKDTTFDDVKEELNEDKSGGIDLSDFED